jgi:hypothetical protein
MAQDPALYAHNVRNLMAEKLGVEVTEYTYEDALLMVEGLTRTRTTAHAARN